MDLDSRNHLGAHIEERLSLARRFLALGQLPAHLLPQTTKSSDSNQDENTTLLCTMLETMRLNCETSLMLSQAIATKDSANGEVNIWEGGLDRA